MTASHAADDCSGSSSVQVRVVGTITATQTFSPQQICQMYDVFNPQYQVRQRAGDPAQDVGTANAVLSIRKLVTSVDVGPSSQLPLGRVTFVQVLDRDGHAHGLDETEVRDPGSVFLDGLVPAIWHQAGSGESMFYIRPLTGPNDVNGADNLQLLPHQQLVVIAHTAGSLLFPAITANPSSVDAGQRVAFSASFGDPQPTGHLQFEWNFGDGATSTKARPSHRYTAECSCGVHLEVTSADGSSGAANASVQVGPAPTKPPTTGPTKGPTSPPTSPGGQEGGPTSGPTSTAPTTVATAGPTGNAGPSGPAGALSSGPTKGQSAGPTSAPSRSAGPGGSDGREVSGRLLLAGQVYAVPQAEPPPSQAAQARPPDHLGRDWWWTLSLLLPLLVGLGAAGEAVQLRRRVARMGL